MKKLLVLIIALSLSTLLVLAASPVSNDIYTEFVNSINNCKTEKSELYPICASDYYEARNDCSIDYNACESNSIICKLEYMECLITINLEKRTCRKNIIIDYKECKRESREKKDVCIAVYEPVCGIDGKTYSNSCVLDLAGVEQACDGECPCESALIVESAEGPVCGNAICEQDEADYVDCPLCTTEPCPGHPCIFKPGTCPQDC